MRRFENVHPNDQSVLEPVAVADAGIGDQIAGAGVVDYLMDIDGDTAVRLLGEPLGLDLARDGGELPSQIVADRRAADLPTAFPGVGPIDLGGINAIAASTSRALNAR
jgi:hypothetical protein